MISYWRIALLLFLFISLPVALFILHIPKNKTKSIKVIGTIILCICLIFELPHICIFIQLFLHHDDLQEMENLISRHRHDELATPLHRLSFACFSLRQSSHALDNIKRSTFSAKIASCSYQSPHMVLVIGESYNKHHSSLYGYELQTTPLQQKRVETGEIFIFKDVVTRWNFTTNVFLDIFSLYENGMKEANMPLFPILFRRAGYSVNFFPINLF